MLLQALYCALLHLTGSEPACCPQASTVTISCAVAPIACHSVCSYDISPRASGQEPVGGAARMASMLRSFGPEALVLFSGDAFNPSLLSTVTQVDAPGALDCLRAAHGA